jgi:hypothetical protein
MADGGLLRVGVVLDGPDVPRWQQIAVSELDGSGVCEVILLRSHPERAGRRALRRWLYHAYERADRRVFGRPDDALEPVKLTGSWSSAADRAAIAAEDLDVVLCLSSSVRVDGLAGSARFGAWSLAAEAQLLAELGGGGAAVPVTLRAHTPAEGTRAIYRSFVQADLVSLHRARCSAYRRAARLPARGLRDLHRRGSSSISESPPDDDRPDSAAPPGNLAMAGLVWRVARGVVARRIAGWLGEKQWFLAYRRLDTGPATDAASAPLTPILPPPGRFYADPFLFERDGRRYVFFEDYDWSRRAAVICYLELDERGRPGPPRAALRQDCHLSYPLVFEQDGAVYMLPETAGHRRVELYRATGFPDEWTLDRVLLDDVSATDATLLRHEGRLWLFVAIDVDGGRPLDELFLYSSDSLAGAWEPHPLNPVVSDVRRARPAGRIFTREGQLIRPAQDCSRSYGWRLVFNRIEVLSRVDYREQPVGSIEPVPESGNLRTHSYDSDGTFEVVDGFRVRPRVRLPGVARASARPRWRRTGLESAVAERSPL